jgi:hypothetical protein
MKLLRLGGVAMVQLSQSGGSSGGSKEDSLAGLISVLLGKTMKYYSLTLFAYFVRIRLFDLWFRRSLFRDGLEVFKGFYLAAEHSAVYYWHRNELGKGDSHQLHGRMISVQLFSSCIFRLP